MTDAVSSFRRAFGTEPEAVSATPGRVNIIGEHTDYHEGYVLPTVLPQRTLVALRRRPDGTVRAHSAAMQNGRLEFTIGHEERTGTWVDYVQAVTATLAATGMRPPGFDLHIESDIPIGSGLSSSAALLVGLLRALREVLGLPLDDVALAQAARRAETDFIGAPVGIMDQMVCSIGRTGEALFIDTRTLAFSHIPFPADPTLLVIDSGTSHSHATGGYGSRRAESYEAAALLGVRVLRDLTVDDLPRIDRLPATLARRARHVVTENQRVLDALGALRSSRWADLGALLTASHQSLRDDYEVSTPDVDTLVSTARRTPGVLGARMTGGGFGGSVVILAAAARGLAVAQDIASGYSRETGRAGRVLVPIG